MNRAILVAFLLLAPLAAGCLSDEPSDDGTVPNGIASAEEAGAQTGEAPVAPKEAYAVASDDGAQTTAYPVAVDTNAARAPVTVDFSGEFRPTDCRPFGMGFQTEQTIAPVSHSRRETTFADALQVGDVFSYNITLTYTNAPDNWGEIHMAYGLGSTIQQHNEPTRELTDVVISFSGQGYRVADDDMAWLFVGCFFGAMTRAIPYTLTATFTFAEGAVPAEAPMLLSVPEGATKLHVRGVAIDGEEGVLSHFRLFRPDDTILCECALSSGEEVATIEITAPGDYVLIVDHTANGFVSVALDAPPTEPLRALGAEWVEQPIFASDGGAVDTTLELELERVPLLMFTDVFDKDGAGAGKRTVATFTNARGQPLHASWGGHLTWANPTGGNSWLGIWPDDWEYTIDHHAFAQGGHVVKITAEELRGTIMLLTRHYVR